MHTQSGDVRFGPAFSLGFNPSEAAPDAVLMPPSEEPVPFRLTRNLHTLFTPFGVEGGFIPTLAAAADATCASGAGLDAHVRLFYADVVAMSWRGGTSWYHVQQSAAVGAAATTPDAYAHVLSDVARMSADGMVARITGVAPQAVITTGAAGGAASGGDHAAIARAAAAPALGAFIGGCPPLHKGVAALVELAMSPAHLCRMPLDWQPWL